MAAPVARFALLIVPLVMNGFFAVYALTGWVLDGRDLRNWSLEAETVALRVGIGIALFCVPVALGTRLLGGRWRHPLIWSSLFHILVALGLTLSVFAATRL